MTNLNSLLVTSVCPLGVLSLRSLQIITILVSCPKIAEPMELSLVKEIARWVGSVDSFFMGKLMGVGLHSARHYHNMCLDLSILKAAAQF
jgi:hypothetical protein